MTCTESAKLLEKSQPGIGYAVSRGERVAKENKYQPLELFTYLWTSRGTRLINLFCDEDLQELSFQPETFVFLFRVNVCNVFHFPLEEAIALSLMKCQSMHQLIPLNDSKHIARRKTWLL